MAPIFFLACTALFMVAGIIWSIVHDHTAFGFFLTYLVSSISGGIFAAVFLVFWPEGDHLETQMGLPAAE